MPESLKSLVKDLEKGFFWFWVRKYKVSFLLTFLIMLSWIMSVLMIWKDANPALDLWQVNITTVYLWVSPDDMDTLVTEKIEREIKDVKWIKKIVSTSSLWVSSVTVELKNWVDKQKVLTEIKDWVDKASLPWEAEDPVVINIDTEDNSLFNIMLYWKKWEITQDYLLEKATVLKNSLEWKWKIDKIDISWGEDYKVFVLLDKEKIEALWLWAGDVANIISSYNKNTPIWNFSIKDLKYDYRFDWEIKEIKELLDFPITSSDSSIVYLRDIAEVKRKFDNDAITSWGFYEDTGYLTQTLTIKKASSDDIFASSKKAKETLEEELHKWEYEGIKYEITNDGSEVIIDDYKDLFGNMMSTFVLVFITLLLFIWFKEGFLATVIIPLAYLVTFIVLYYAGFRLNFLTNFSLILSLWVAIDTIIVIIEAANKNLKLWLSPKTAVLIAVRDYKAPLISGTLTTLAAFLPLMFLPGVTWKYLAYIPVTIFITLLASLFLSLTVTQAIFMKISKWAKTFRRNPEEESVMDEIELELLEFERQWKTEKVAEHSSLHWKLFEKMTNLYYNTLKAVVSKKINRLLIIFIPFFLLIWTFKVFDIWFILFPKSDNPFINIEVSWREWRNSESLVWIMPSIEEKVSKIEEVKNFSIKADTTSVVSTIELLKKDIRDERWLRNSFDVEKELNTIFDEFRKDWFRVETSVASNWPPEWKAVWIKLIADSKKDFQKLITISKDFEDFLKDKEWTKNVSSTAKETPGQFVFNFKKDKLQDLGLTPNDILWEIATQTFWRNAWVLKWEYDDYDIKIKLADFEDDLSPSDIENMVINTRVWKIKVWDVVSYDLEKAVANIKREDRKINIVVWADVEDWYLPTDFQPALEAFAKEYNYPEWTSFEAWWEAADNADLIIATLSAFFISLFIIFAILVLQFNSYGQPLIVLYSVVLAMLWVNIWLVIMDQPRSMAFAIWFIALTWIVINNAIILIDKMNINIKEWLKWVEAIANAWKSRLIPMLATTITTILWIYPISQQDEFWAWLWYTIIFGLIAWTTMTLFAIPSLYYIFFVDEEPGLIRKLFRFIKSLIIKAKDILVGKIKEKNNKQNMV